MKEKMPVSFFLVLLKEVRHTLSRVRLASIEVSYPEQLRTFSLSLEINNQRINTMLT